MDVHKKVEIQKVSKEIEKDVPCRVCRLIRVYLLFAIPTLALFWLGVDFGIGDVDAQDLVVKVVSLVLFFSILRRVYLDFFRSGK